MRVEVLSDSRLSDRCRHVWTARALKAAGRPSAARRGAAATIRGLLPKPPAWAGGRLTSGTAPPAACQSLHLGYDRRRVSTDEVGQKLVDFFDKSFANLDCVQLYVLEESETDPAMLRICGGIGKGEMAELSKSSLAEAIEKCEPLLIEPTHLEPQGTLALPLFSQLPPKHGLALDSSPRNSSTEVDAAPTPPKVNPMESERAAAAASAAAALSASVTSTTTPAAHGRNSGGLDTKSMRPIGIMVLKRTPLIPPPTPSRHWRERRSSDNNINLSAGRLRRSSDNSLRFDPSLSRFRRSSDESIKVDGGSPGVSGRGTPLAVRGLRERRMFSRDWVYHLAIGLDLVLRFGWTATLIPQFQSVGYQLDNGQWLEISLQVALACGELCRRAMWAVFRLEAEHLHNTEGLRRIAVIPLHFDPKREASEAQTAEPVRRCGVLVELLAYATLVGVLALLAALTRPRPGAMVDLD